MDTIARGNAFEIRVFEAIKCEVEAERLGISPKTCKIFRKKKYYSRDRDDHIEVDVSIEVFLPGAPNWSLLWIVECKDYSSSVPVDDVEEFHSKIQQIAGDNVKATLAVRGALQRSALNFARARGIGIIRILPDEQVKHVLYRTSSLSWELRLDPNETLKALTTPSFIGINRNFYACDDQYVYGDWFSLIRRTLSVY